MCNACSDLLFENYIPCHLFQFCIATKVWKVTLTCLKCQAADKEVLTISNSFRTVEQIEQSKRARGWKKVSLDDVISC